MADFSSFYQKSIYFTIIMFIFIIVFNFVVALNIFGNVTTGPIIGGDTEGYASTIFGTELTMSQVWGIGAGATIIGAVGIAILTGSMIAVAVYMYSCVFWTGFINMWGIVGGLFVGTLNMFFGIGFAIMVVIFIAAVIGMLGGAG
jgi:hypothetical protein